MSFKGRILLVEAGGDEKAAGGVELDAIRAARLLPIVDELLRGGVGCAVGVAFDR